jgi:two-component system phosphate regulon response regulator PhoB
MKSMLRPKMERETERTRILLLEGERRLRKAIVMSLKQLDVEIEEAPDAQEARVLLEDNPAPDILIVDLDYPEAKNSELIDLFRQKDGDEKRIVLVTTTERPKDKWRQSYHPDMILYKPFDIRYLIRRIRAYL